MCFASSFCLYVRTQQYRDMLFMYQDSLEVNRG